MLITNTLILLIIYNKSLSSGLFPYKWKLAEVVPNFNSQHNRLISNYKASLYSVCYLKNIWIINLLGRINRSHISQISLVHNHKPCSINQTVDKCNWFWIEAVSIFTDFNKAFEKISRRLLINKLRAYGNTESVLKWIRSY